MPTVVRTCVDRRRDRRCEPGLNICLRCAARFDSASWLCPHCAICSRRCMGSPCTAPQLAEASISGFSHEDFDLSFFSRGAKFLVSRTERELIIAAIRRVLRRMPECMLEIGCGTGFVLQGISTALSRTQAIRQRSGFGRPGVCRGVEIQGPTLFQMVCNPASPTKPNSTSLARSTCSNISRTMERLSPSYTRRSSPGVMRILSVPQHMFLWSAQDLHARHFRRYEVRQLEHKLQAAGFMMKMRSSFVTIFLPMLYLSRRFPKQRATVGHRTLN